MGTLNMLSDRRCCMRHVAIDLLMIRANHIAWLSAKYEQLIDTALKGFTMSRCKLKVTGTDGECRSRSVTLVHNDGYINRQSRCRTGRRIRHQRRRQQQ